MGALFLMSLVAGCSTTPQKAPPAPDTAELHHTREPAADTEQPRPDAPPVQQQEPQATAPTVVEEENPGEEIALRAIALVGKPYRYGGVDLKGFDCSGLVVYIFHELGIDIPRSAAEQYQRALHVSRSDLMPGDLVFFHINRRRISHVGIYVGENRFVHAPQTGKHVELRNLDDSYFARRWVGAGRIE